MDSERSILNLSVIGPKDTMSELSSLQDDVSLSLMEQIDEPNNHHNKRTSHENVSLLLNSHPHGQDGNGEDEEEEEDDEGGVGGVLNASPRPQRRMSTNLLLLDSPSMKRRGRFLVWPAEEASLEKRRGRFLLLNSNEGLMTT